ncbi:hypothetical protein C5167_036586 [Papaver somniferum]|uniref:Uncharacterized protein n=1 Tax=Papaver somniferum TaxID=3469 RepID=A0A4Y7I8A0_PAPSO|nr:hypothetical protein C5167_036586 [Papaver somniferum]
MIPITNLGSCGTPLDKTYYSETQHLWSAGCLLLPQNHTSYCYLVEFDGQFFQQQQFYRS